MPAGAGKPPLPGLMTLPVIDSPETLSRADKRFNFAACLTDAVGWPLGAALVFPDDHPAGLFEAPGGEQHRRRLPARALQLAGLPARPSGRRPRQPAEAGARLPVLDRPRRAVRAAAPGPLDAALGADAPRLARRGAVPDPRHPRGRDGVQPARLLGRGRQVRPARLARAAVRVCGRDRRRPGAWGWTACCGACCPARTAASRTATPSASSSGSC